MFYCASAASGMPVDWVGGLSAETTEVKATLLKTHPYMSERTADSSI